mmetsp:Transcript_50495/g.110446  ORF Transcript_50495/g.110446 Transcript_50495/m.110446 type:complete len:264 (-) Transcript_50495:952-1743(-)
MAHCNHSDMPLGSYSHRHQPFVLWQGWWWVHRRSRDNFLGRRGLPHKHRPGPMLRGTGTSRIGTGWLCVATIPTLRCRLRWRGAASRVPSPLSRAALHSTVVAGDAIFTGGHGTAPGVVHEVLAPGALRLRHHHVSQHASRHDLFFQAKLLSCGSNVRPFRLQISLYGAPGLPRHVGIPHVIFHTFHIGKPLIDERAFQRQIFYQLDKLVVDAGQWQVVSLATIWVLQFHRQLVQAPVPQLHHESEEYSSQKILRESVHRKRH